VASLACGSNCTDFSNLRSVDPGGLAVFANPLQYLFKLFFTLGIRFLMGSRGAREPAAMQGVNLVVFHAAFIVQFADTHALHVSLAT
jgi:hypothetical protein